MGSRKQSARERQRAAFEAGLGQGSHSLDDAFASAAAQRERMAADHEAHLRHKACERKKPLREPHRGRGGHPRLQATRQP